MKIGIIVYSQTGNTLSVAQNLREKLLTAGHSVNLEPIKTTGDGQTDMNKIQFETLPNISQYDVVIFGAPVQAFSLSLVMRSYLSQISSMEGKKFACLVTQFFPYAWLGGNRAISQMKKLCELKGGKICGTGIVNWSSKEREKKINDAISNICASL